MPINSRTTQSRQNDVLSNLAYSIKEWLLNPTDAGITGSEKSIELNIPNGFGLSKDQVNITFIDLGDYNVTYSPSSHAWDLVRDVIETIDMSNMERNSIINKRNDILYNSIIDVWIMYEDIEPTISSELTFDNPSNEHNSNMKNKLDEANSDRNNS